MRSTMNFLPKFFFLFAFLLVFQNCQISEKSSFAKATLISQKVPDNFKEYWYNGQAEINSYHLEQSRYGETRIGDAIFVFVTEDFSKEKQVKLDRPANAENDKIPILKLNHLRKFNTGIYDYSMMQSVFTPVDLESHPNSLKMTASSQEWCGHTYTQFNLEDKGYRINAFSYFESEGDQNFKSKKVFLEDELISRIRIDPSSIPTGNIELMPAAFFTRLQHQPLKAKQARISIEKKESTASMIIEYLHLERTVSVEFESFFPYKILSFKEDNGNGKITKATLKKSIKNAYWSKNSNEYLSFRDSLQLKY